jgi:hypothetical protein
MPAGAKEPVYARTEETMSEGFTIANFRTVAHGPQEGQFAVGERKKALGLSDLDPKYRRLLDEPVTMTLGLIGPGGRVALTPMWFDYEGEQVLVNTASHRPKCEWIRKNPRLTILLVNPKNPYHWVQIKCTVEKELREWEPGGRIRDQTARPHLAQVYPRPIRPLQPARSEDRREARAVCVRYRSDRHVRRTVTGR